MTAISEYGAPLGDDATIERLIDELSVQKKEISHAGSEAREQMILKARELVAALETPLEAILWMIWGEVRAICRKFSSVRYLT